MPAERDHLGKALDIAVRLSIVGIVVLSAFRIFSPFLVAVTWDSSSPSLCFPSSRS